MLLMIIACGQKKHETIHVDDEDAELEDAENARLFLWENYEGEIGFIDKTGELVIPCKWKNAWDFSEDLALVRDEEYMGYYIDKTGRVVK